MEIEIGFVMVKKCVIGSDGMMWRECVIVCDRAKWVDSE